MNFIRLIFALYFVINSLHFIVMCSSFFASRQFFRMRNVDGAYKMMNTMFARLAHARVLNIF